MSKVKMMSAKSKKGPLAPRLRFPEFQDVGEWQESFLGEYSGVVRGGSPRPIDNFLTIEKDGLNWLKIGDIDKEVKYVVATSEKVRAEALNKTREISPSDLILSNSMSFGRPYISKIKTCIHDGWIAITKISKKLLTDYIYYLISSPFSQYYFTSNAAGSGVQNLNADIIKALPIFFPSVLEQQKIADCLSSLDESIAAETNKLDALKAHKKGLLKQLFPAEGETTPALRFPEFRDAEDWEINLLGQISENLDNRRVPITENVRIRGAIPYYGASGIVDYVNDFIFDEELLCVSEDGANLIARTSPIAFSISGKSWINNHVHVLKFYFPLRQKLVENYINFIKIDEFLTGMAQPKLNKAKLEVIPIPIPPTEKEEQKIADCLSSLDELITAQTQKIDLLKDHKKGLMQQLFPRIEEVRV